jgi:hypothetical protein
MVSSGPPSGHITAQLRKLGHDCQVLQQQLHTTQLRRNQTALMALSSGVPASLVAELAQVSKAAVYKLRREAS